MSDEEEDQEYVEHLRELADGFHQFVHIKFAWVEILHAPGKRDDGKASLWTDGFRPQPITAEDGVNGTPGTWTTVHKVFYDPTPDE